MWVHLYECETRLVRQSGLRGSQPVLDGTGTLYVIGPAVDVAEGSLVTVKRWNYQELRVVESPFFVPVKISPHNRCYLTGVAGYPPRLYLYTYDAETGAPGYVWKYDRAGRLMGAVSLTEHLPPTPVRWMSSAARFAVDAAGDLCVSWADPEKGYSISKLPTSQLGE